MGDFPGSQTGQGRVNELELTSAVASSGDVLVLCSLLYNDRSGKEG